MKPVNTLLKLTQAPPAPKKGDIEACKHYANYIADNSQNAPRTLARIWIKFINYSYLQDEAPQTKYTGWKQQQAKLAKLKAKRVEVQA